MLKRATKLGFGFVVYSAGVFLAYDWYQNRNVGNRPLISGTVDESERIRLFTEIASRYDSLVGAEEKLTNTTDLRRKLVEHCSGEVLEVASGTGRNLQYYSSAVQRLTLVDTSEAMTKTAARKWADLQEQSHPPLTAVQCITADAIKVLKEIGRVLKPGGRVMLLEHGESHNVAMSVYQKWRAESHLRKWGCYWDRPILALVSSSPLIIDEHSSHHMGTVTMIHAHAPLREDESQLPRPPLPIAAISPIL